MNDAPEAIREFLRYEPDTGIFFWTKRPHPTVEAGAQAGTIGTRGYILISFKRKLYRANRLAWWFLPPQQGR